MTLWPTENCPDGELTSSVIWQHYMRTGLTGNKLSRQLWCSTFIALPRECQSSLSQKCILINAIRGWQNWVGLDRLWNSRGGVLENAKVKTHLFATECHKNPSKAWWMANKRDLIRSVIISPMLCKEWAHKGVLMHSCCCSTLVEMGKKHRWGYKVEPHLLPISSSHKDTDASMSWRRSILCVQGLSFNPASPMSCSAILNFFYSCCKPSQFIFITYLEGMNNLQATLSFVITGTQHRQLKQGR